MDELERVAGRDRQGGRGRAASASRVATSAAWCRPIADSGASAWPWKRPSTMYVDSPWRTRTSVASRPSGMSGGSAAVSARSRAGSSTGRGPPPGSGSPRTTASGTSSSSARIMNASSRGRVRARCIALMLMSASPSISPTRPTVPGPVHVAGDEHVVGRRHVEPVVVEPGDPRLAAGDRPGHDRRPAAGLARQREQRGERAGVGRLALDDGDPARLGEGAGVDQVDPLGDRGLEQPAQDRGGQWRPVVLGQLAGDLEASACARRRARTGRRTGRGSRPAAGTARSRGPSPA